MPSHFHTILAQPMIAHRTQALSPAQRLRSILGQLGFALALFFITAFAAAENAGAEWNSIRPGNARSGTLLFKAVDEDSYV